MIIIIGHLIISYLVICRLIVFVLIQLIICISTHCKGQQILSLSDSLNYLRFPTRCAQDLRRRGRDGRQGAIPHRAIPWPSAAGRRSWRKSRRARLGAAVSGDMVRTGK